MSMTSVLRHLSDVILSLLIRISLNEYLPEDFHKYLDMPEPPIAHGPGSNDDLYLSDWEHAHNMKHKLRFMPLGFYAAMSCQQFNGSKTQTRNLTFNYATACSLADENGDGRLQLLEFYSFIHPEESRNEKLHEFAIKEEIRSAATCSHSVNLSVTTQSDLLCPNACLRSKGCMRLQKRSDNVLTP